MNGQDPKNMEEEDLSVPPSLLDEEEEEGEEQTIIADFNPLYRTDPGRDQSPAPESPAEPFRSTGAASPATGSDAFTGTDASAIPPRADAAPMEADRPVRRPSLHVGTIINGNYKVMEELKSGGMGRVFRGETIGNELPVAIKTVKADLADDPKYGELFRSESKVLGSLRDDAIVNYNNFQYDAALNRWFLVMEFIPGEALSDYVGRNGGITVVQAARLLRRVAHGLSKAHEVGVIHRDLSPDNVMLRNGDLSQAVLIDFGIAKSFAGETQDNRSSFAGKLKYAAPEQLGLFDGEVGPQTDVYGLGLMMSAALTGRPLPMGKSLQSAMDARRQVPDLSALPVPFRPLISQMLQPNPAARPDGMHGVIANIPAVEGRTSSGLSTSSLGSGPDIAAHVPGLRRPPKVTRPMGVSGSGTLPTGLETGTATLSGAAASVAAPADPPKGKSALPGILLGLLLLAGAGGAGYYFLNSPTDVADPPASTETTEAAPPTEEGFLAGFDLGDCTHAALQRDGEPSSGEIALFAAAPVATGPLQDGFNQTFGSASPSIAEEMVSPMQCAVLDAARRLQSDTEVQIRLTTQPITDAALRGAIIDGEDRKLWLAAINRNGQVTPLNNFRSDKSGDSSAFNIPLNLASKNFPFVIAALATPVPLIETAMLSSGTDSQTSFANILKEIDDKGIAAQSALRILRLDAP